jgi:adenylosuccinate synthase
VRYKIDGKETAEIPAQDSGYAKIKPIYEKMPGWKTSTQGIRTMEKLPKPARAYLAFVEKQTGARVGMVSTGPDREQTILVEEFADELKAAASQKKKVRAKT